MLEQNQRWLIGVKREVCESWPDTRARYYLDITEEDEFEAALVRLVAQLRQPPDIEWIET